MPEVTIEHEYRRQGVEIIWTSEVDPHQALRDFAARVTASVKPTAIVMNGERQVVVGRCVACDEFILQSDAACIVREETFCAACFMASKQKTEDALGQALADSVNEAWDRKPPPAELLDGPGVSIL